MEPIQVITSFHTITLYPAELEFKNLNMIEEIQDQKISRWAVQYISTEWITFTYSFFVVLNWMLLKISLESLI